MYLHYNNQFHTRHTSYNTFMTLLPQLSLRKININFFNGNTNLLEKKRLQHHHPNQKKHTSITKMTKIKSQLWTFMFTFFYLLSSSPQRILFFASFLFPIFDISISNTHLFGLYKYTPLLKHRTHFHHIRKENSFLFLLKRKY